MKFITCPVCDQLIIKVTDSKQRIRCCDNEIDEHDAKEPNQEHRPVIRKIGNFMTVNVINHPMIESHYIAAIFLETNLGFQYKSLKPHQEAKAEFVLNHKEDVINVYIYCNVHMIFKLY